MPLSSGSGRDRGERVWLMLSVSTGTPPESRASSGSPRVTRLSRLQAEEFIGRTVAPGLSGKLGEQCPVGPVPSGFIPQL